MKRKRVSDGKGNKAFSFTKQEKSPKMLLTVILRRVRLSWLGLLGEKNSMNVGQDTPTGNGDISKKFVQFFVILDRQGNVTGNDTALLVITSGIASQFQNFGTKVFQNSGQVDGGTSSHTSSVLALTQVSADTTDGELQSSLGGGALRSLLVSATSLSFS